MIRWAVAATLLALASVQPVTAAGLSHTRQLAAAYDAILDAEFERVPALLTAVCGKGTAPPPVCQVMDVVSRWWQLQADPLDRQGDAEFERRVNAAIAATETWAAAEPGSAEAWFYVGGSYSARVQWRVLRGQRMAAARDGKRIKDALERALELNPMLQDAWFGIGLYHYYADVAPAALKFLRFLLLLPGGDRAQGLQEMLRARERGELLRGEADYQLHWLYLWYEQQPARALELLQGLDARYPTNPLFLQRIADVRHVYFSDHQGSADSWKALLDRATAAGAALPQLAAARARVGLAAEEIELAAPARAIDLLSPVIRARSAEPYGVLALAFLTRGDAYAAIGDRENAIASYTSAIENAPSDDPDRVRTRARDALARMRSKR